MKPSRGERSSEIKLRQSTETWAPYKSSAKKSNQFLAFKYSNLINSPGPFFFIGRENVTQTGLPITSNRFDWDHLETKEKKKHKKQKKTKQLICNGRVLCPQRPRWRLNWPASLSVWQPVDPGHLSDFFLIFLILRFFTI